MKRNIRQNEINWTFVEKPGRFLFVSSILKSVISTQTRDLRLARGLISCRFNFKFGFEWSNWVRNCKKFLNSLMLFPWRKNLMGIYPIQWLHNLFLTLLIYSANLITQPIEICSKLFAVLICKYSQIWKILGSNPKVIRYFMELITTLYFFVSLQIIQSIFFFPDHFSLLHHRHFRCRNNPKAENSKQSERRERETRCSARFRTVQLWGAD